MARIIRAIHFQPWHWLYIVCFLDLLGASMIMPVFSSHLHAMGISHINIGFLSSLYGFTQLVSGPLIGSWSDVNGRYPILCLSMIICSLSYGLMGLVSSYYSFLILRCIIGLFKHTQTLCRACIADIVPVEKQATVHGLTNAFTSFSFMIGPVIGGHIMELENGFQYLTGLVLLTFVLNAAVVYVFGNYHTHSAHKTENITFTKRTALVFQELYNIEWKSLWALFCVKFLFGLSGILFFSNLGLILTENFNIHPQYMGYTISFYGFISTLSNLTVDKIKSFVFSSRSQVKSLTYIFFVMAVTFLMLYIVDNYFIFLIGLIPLSASHALSRILITELLLDQADECCRGSLMGASGTITAIARVIIPFLSGIIISWGGVSITLLASSLVTLVACALTVIYTYHRRYKVF